MRQFQRVKDLEKARAICLDVLGTLYARKYTRGTYGMITIEQDDLDQVTDLQQLLPQIEETCSVCLKGSMLLSKAKLYDEVPKTDLTTYSLGGERTELSFNGNMCERHLSTIFDPLTLDMMENAFEARMISECDAYDWNGVDEMDQPTRCDVEELLMGAAQFGADQGGHQERVQAVIENVLSNNGVFVVEPQSFFDNEEDDDYDDDFDDDEDDDDFPDDDADDEEDEDVFTPSTATTTVVSTAYDKDVAEIRPTLFQKMRQRLSYLSAKLGF